MTKDLLLEEALMLDCMALYSRHTAFVCLCTGDTEGASFWRGRARGLSLAATNLRALVLDADRA